MEITNQQENNCFLDYFVHRNTHHDPNQVESLAYICSENSMPSKTTPPKTPQNENSVYLGGFSDVSSDDSATDYLSTHNINNVRDSHPENDDIKIGSILTDYKTAFMKKVNKFSNWHKSSPVNVKISQGITDKTNENPMAGQESEKIGDSLSIDRVQQLYLHTSPFSTTSTESDRASLEEIFSSGVSEISEEDNNIEEKSTPDGRSENFPSRRSTENPDHERFQFPKGKLPTDIKNSQTCQKLVDEIIKSNLVMKEDIYSSSRTSNIGNGTAQSLNDYDIKSAKCSNKSKLQIEMNKFLARKKKSSEIFESEDCTINFANQAENRKRTRRPRQGFYECNNFFNVANGDCGQNWPGVSIKERYVKLPGLPEVSDENVVNRLKIQNGSEFTNVNAISAFRQHGAFIEEYNPGKAEFMLRINCPVIKNPGSHYDAIQENIRRDIGTSCENLICKPEKEQSTQNAIGKPATRDNSTFYEVPLEHRKKSTVSQTSPCSFSNKRMINTSAQCDLYVADQKSSGMDAKRKSQEIMICDDNGNSIQLYNRLGHPLTDMDGYLLKDSRGRFLVQLDHYGVPLFCTNGDTIFLDDGSEWESKSGKFNVIHQQNKRALNFKKSPFLQNEPFQPPYLNSTRRRTENLHQTIKWHNARLNFEEEMNTLPMPSHELPYDRPTTFVEEIESIETLRGSLLNNISFISGTNNKNAIEKPNDNQVSLGTLGKSVPELHSRGFAGLHRPTYSNPKRQITSNNKSNFQNMYHKSSSASYSSTFVHSHVNNCANWKSWDNDEPYPSNIKDDNSCRVPFKSTMNPLNVKLHLDNNPNEPWS